MAGHLERFEVPDLSGDVALVTGAGCGIGKAIALALASAGARVILTSRTESEQDQGRAEIESAGGHGLAVTADVSDPAGVAWLVDQAAARFGPISVLVNNAGVLEPVGLLWEVDPDEWWHNLEINLRGPFLCTRAVLPGMISRGRGRIANLASGAAKVPIADVARRAILASKLLRPLLAQLPESSRTWFDARKIVDRLDFDGRELLGYVRRINPDRVSEIFAEVP